MSATGRTTPLMDASAKATTSLGDRLMPHREDDRVGETHEGHMNGRLASPEEREPEQRRPQVPDAVIADAFSAVVNGPRDQGCSRQQHDVKRPDRHPAKDGQHAVGSDLLPMLIQLRAGFPSAYKISVTSFQLDRREVLTAQTDRGWTIIFGQMVTSDDRASLEPKLAALRALSGRIDLVSAPIQYINLENARAPAVQMRAHK